MTTDITLPKIVAEKHESKSFTRHLPTVARILMGLMFFVFGLNGFLNFIPQPKNMEIPEFALAMMKTGYMFPLVKGTEVLVGLLLLLNRFVPLALAVIAPIVINIVAFHAFLAPSGIAVPIVIALLEIYLAWAYRKVYRPMLAMRVTAN